MPENFSKSIERSFVPAESGQDKGIKDAARVTQEENKIIVASRKSAASQELHPVELTGAPGYSDKQSWGDMWHGHFPRPGSPVTLPGAHPNDGAHQPDDTHSEAGSIGEWGIEDPEAVPHVDLHSPFWQNFAHGHIPAVEPVPESDQHRLPLAPVSRNRPTQTASPPPDAHANTLSRVDENNHPGSVRGGADGGL